MGIRVRTWRGIATIMGIGGGLGQIGRSAPDGLLAHEQIFFSLRHIGMRQYWRDLASLEAFTRSEPHRTWWRQFTKDTGGTGFWHESYRMKGGMEAVYLDMPRIGFSAFAPELAPTGPFMSARGRFRDAQPSAPPAA